MTRLTKIDRYGHFYTNNANCRNIYSLDGEIIKGEFFKNHTLAIDGEAINKLGKLEDLEEQLGCPLELVLDIIINCKPIYYKTSEGVKLKLQPMFISNCGIKCNQWYYSCNLANSKPDEFMISFEDYQKNLVVGRRET